MSDIGRDPAMHMRKSGKTIAAIEAAKAAQRQGKRVVWATVDQATTSQRLSKHGALCELVGVDYVIPHFKEPKV